MNFPHSPHQNCGISAGSGKNNPAKANILKSEAVVRGDLSNAGLEDPLRFRNACQNISDATPGKCYYGHMVGGNRDERWNKHTNKVRKCKGLWVGCNPESGTLPKVRLNVTIPD